MDATKIEIKDLNTFDPNVEKLQALVAESAGIVEVNLDDPEQLKTVKAARIKLRDARVLIEKTGKAYREDALAYQRAVLSKEKDLIAIIEPEETRLKLFEKSAEIQKEKRLRIAQLPERRARLEKEGFPINESTLLEMDSVAFETHFNGLVAEKNRKAGEAIAQKEREQKEEGERLAKERRTHRINQLVALGLEEKRDTLELGAIKITAADLDLDEASFGVLILRVTPEIAKEKEAIAERARKQREEDEERGRQAERDRIAREAKEKEEREAKEKAELEKKRAYQKFLTDNGYTPASAGDFKIENTPEGVVLWKRVATYKPAK